MRTVSDTGILASLLSHNAVTLCNQHEMFTTQGLSQNKLIRNGSVVPLRTAGIGMVFRCPDSGSYLIHVKLRRPSLSSVIPAQPGIQSFQYVLDPRSSPG